jgi:mono/diheme cytochrome c family protein
VGKLFFLTICVALVGCSGGAPEDTSESAEVSAGRALFERNCALCHGKDGVARSLATGAADLNDPEWQELVTVEDISDIIAEGRGQMPSWKDRLSEQQIRSIAEHVMTLAPAAPKSAE